MGDELDYCKLTIKCLELGKIFEELLNSHNIKFKKILRFPGTIIFEYSFRQCDTEHVVELFYESKEIYIKSNE